MIMQIITTHTNTDFDALASVVAANILFPAAKVILPQNVNPNVQQFLSLHKDVFSYVTSRDVDIEMTHRLIVVDTNSWKRLDGMQRLSSRGDIEILLFDHHDGNGSILANCAYRETVGANITLMLRHLKKENTAISPVQANLFLLGLYEDTGNLSFPSTTAEDVQAAADLLRMGAELKVLHAFLGQAYSRKQKDILFFMLGSARRITINGMTVSIVSVNVEEFVENLAMVVHMCRNILNVDAVFGIFVMPGGRNLVIGRSRSESINIGTVMRGIGGGGHSGAGSAMIKLVNPGVVAAWIRILIGESAQEYRYVEDLMSTPAFALDPTTTMQEAFTALRQQGHHGAPVVENGRIVGVLSLRDFKKIRKRRQYNITIKAFMSRDVIWIGARERVDRAAYLMAKHDIGRLPVLENQRLVGIITRSDAMNDFYGFCPLDGNLTPKPAKMLEG
jgi:tRNA nucleotidyltransferase (CCA-adding enzyme)